MLHDLPRAISTFAPEIDRHIALILWIVGAWFLLAQAVLFYLAIRFRRGAHARPAWVPGDTAKANAWVLVPAVLVLGFDLVIEWDSDRVWRTVKQEVPEDGVLVRVTGRQFAWEFTHAGLDGKLDTPDDVPAVGTLVVPRGEPVRFQLESADVLHSFYVPELRLKQDAVPGRSIPGWFQATEEGRFTIACAELCGSSHTYMLATLEVVSPEQYRTFVGGNT